jgi:hypothetical protein
MLLYGGSVCQGFEPLLNRDIGGLVLRISLRDFLQRWPRDPMRLKLER